MVKIKICGIKTKRALEASMDADFVGFVLKTQSSKRNIELNELRDILKDPVTGPKTVAVTRSLKEKDIHDILNSYIFDFIQIHNFAQRSFISKIKNEYGVGIIYLITKKNLNDIDYLKNIVDYFIFDSYENNVSGGTGKENDWLFLKKIRENVPERKMIVAGGINIKNLENVVRTVSPDVVDVSSGVEINGEKDEHMIKSIIKMARGLK